MIRPFATLALMLMGSAGALAQPMSNAVATPTAPTPTSGTTPQLVTVFEPKTDGFRSIRIPAVVVSKQGTVLAFAEGRAADADQAKNKIILKRSTNSGQSWEPVKIIAEREDLALNNPCAVVEQQSGRILLMVQSYKIGISERSNTIRTGYDGDAVVRNWLITSDDDGKTWSAMRDVTRSTKRPTKVTTIASGPGIGIQLTRGKHAGRILMPFNEGPFGIWNIYAVFSDDRGDTWKMGEIAPNGLIPAGNQRLSSLVNEAQLVELSDGSVRFNVRRWAGKAVRKTAISRDGGETWSNVADVPELIDPSCMASILRLAPATPNALPELIYSGPQSTKRERGTVFLSRDDGQTWPIRRVLVPGAFAYSCLTQLPDGQIGCLYEADGTQRVMWARFSREWLLANEPTPPSR
ncbi:sialidase family protein [Tuwongella immobilis]|uniref:exo-alpha-sialidase n=1 Tax=Tuwongella immobilis TaxID=692036 RepID=A0A6C2YKN3_9BACT|nr:sialidase family protein [Tuwongella immobilis]VIP01934.1 sialidase : Sialidase [Precursor] OS=Rhodopirellula baltica (strain SH1) GN=RB3353 PE=4 SV=1: BNR_2 [Tuwongella immobilis]VTR99890.1 sialidase : Sialidase [Precursor] OS=Rhodopirellula baltica (strain SH1) GN=RB3353 PE=4 SV=1: BNR_2 [Tuwongella immobilis]